MTSSPESPTEETLHVLYGTETGNAEELAIAAGRAAAERGLPVSVRACDAAAGEELTRLRHAILIVATSGDGDMPYTAEDLWDQLISAAAPPLPELGYAVLALGDRFYRDFCQAGRDLDEQLATLGARRVLSRQECDVDYEQSAQEWIERALDVFAERMPSRPDERRVTTERITTNHAGGRAWHDGTLESRWPLSADDPEREIVHYGLRLAEAAFDWQPGDSLRIVRDNDPGLVAQVLAALRLDGDQVPEGGTEPIGELLARRFELRQLSRELVSAVADRDPSGTLMALLADRSGRAWQQWQDEHDLLRTLQEHPEARLAPEELERLLRPLQPRSYSIASSPLVDPLRVDLTVRTVRYRQGRRELHGLVSGALSRHTAPGDPLPVQHAPSAGFRLPEEGAADIVMIGPGVGVAPFRGFLQHRAARGDGGRNWLFCGIRDPRSDFLYGDELRAWRDTGLLDELDVCASRGPDTREYVQHRIAARGDELFDWLDGGATLYVCGDARRMAPEVRLAVRAAATRRLGSVDRGEDFVEALQREHRYLQDVY